MIRVADLFCGGGGETGGIVDAAAAAGLRLDLAAVNHWQVAIETHRMNFPQARAYCHDLASLNPHDVFEPRQRVDLLWASPECTHHSNARGGKPRSDQGRAGANLILKWLEELYVHRVILENVVEFMDWGPLGVDGKPLKSKTGVLFNAFICTLRDIGYRVEWQVLCAANYGDPTTRERFFLQAVRGRGKILWPEPTHSNQPDLFGSKPWVPARNIIDWSLHGTSIFGRKKPLAETTMRRIAAGIRRYWGEWAEPFLTAIDNKNGGNRVYSLDDPLRTIVTENRFALVQRCLVPMYGEREGQEPRAHSMEEPVPMIPASGGGKFGVVRPFILHQDAPGAPRSVDAPVPTIRSRNGHGLVQPFVVAYYGTKNMRTTEGPLASVTSRERFALVNGQPVTLDITFRMLQPHELAAAQGFPAGFRFAGNKGDAVKQIGNAVPRGTAKALALAALGAV